MKKQVKKITLKADHIVSLNKNQAQSLKGGQPKPCPSTAYYCD